MDSRALLFSGDEPNECNVEFGLLNNLLPSEYRLVEDSDLGICCCCCCCCCCCERDMLFGIDNGANLILSDDELVPEFAFEPMP